MDKHLHIVCLDVPYPPDYGGVFDLFYKIKTLHEKGIIIHLHCFKSGREKHDELDNYCIEVNYYKRKKGIQSLSLNLPYIVNSRRSKLLEQNLLKDNYPVLLEGVHCTYLLHQNKLSDRKVFVRLHNVEYEYYQQLAEAESSFFKRKYFLHESILLKKYESEIANRAIIIAVTKRDAEVYETIFGAKKIRYLPVFLPYVKVNKKVGRGNFCFYHGNLSVSENEKAAIWLLTNIFNDIDIPFIIAGKSPSKRLASVVAKYKESCMVANPSHMHLKDLISKAQINVIPSFNSTGIKIKLLNALFNGRHCITNEQAIKDTGLELLCDTVNDVKGFKNKVVELYGRLFTNEQTELRRNVLTEIYNNEKNAEKLIQVIW